MAEEQGIEAPRYRFTRVSAVLIDVALWCLCVIVIGLFVYFLGKTAKKLELVVIPLLVALLLTALLQPVVSRLRRWGVGRGLSATLAVLLAIAVLGGVGVFVVNRANAGYQDLVDQIDTLVTKIQHWLQTGPLHLKPSTHDLGTQIVNYLKERKGEFASGAIEAGLTAIELLGALVLTFFLTVFMLYDGDRIWGWVRDLFGASVRPRVDEIGHRAWQTLGGYIRGTFIVAVVHAITIGGTLWFVGVPLVAPLAVIVFVGSFIPVVGIIIAGALCVLVTLVSNGLGAGIIVLVAIVVEHQVEAHILQPFVVGRHVRLHPMAIALTLGAGALLAGLPGAIFGVPLVASLNAALGVLRKPVVLLEGGDVAAPASAPEEPAMLVRLWRRMRRTSPTDEEPGE